MEAQQFDLIIIGAGPAGYEGASIAAAQGRRVCLIERDALGGTCLNRGCIPTKCLCRSAQMAYDMQALGADLGFDIPTEARAIDLPRAQERKRQVVATLAAGVETAVKGATVIRGEASFTGPHTLTVVPSQGVAPTDEPLCLEAPQIIIATGSEPATLPIAGADLTVDSTEILQVEAVPASLAIIGGGVIGMEFASIFAAMGTQVTVIEYCQQILPPFDRDIARRLAKALQGRGVDIITSAAVTGVSAGSGEAARTVNFTCKGKEQSVEAEMVLMAVGRRAVIPTGLTEHTGATVGRRGIETGADFQTAEPGVYAVGDCNGRCMLAHAAAAQMATVLGQTIDLDVVPSAVFTIPECAMVGMTEEAAKATGAALRVAKIPMRSNGKAQTMNEAEGLVKMIVDATTGHIVGCSVMGPDAADLVAEVALAMANKLPVSALVRTIHSHPSLSEAVQAAARALV